MFHSPNKYIFASPELVLPEGIKKKIMIKKDELVEEYIKEAAPFAKPILKHLRKIILETCPEAEEKILHGYPSYLYRDGLLCGILAFKNSCCGLFFAKSKIIDDPKGLLGSHSPLKGVPDGSLSYITDMKKLPSDDIIIGFIKQAMKLNEDGIKAPGVRVGNVVQNLATPDFFQKELDKNSKAKKFYNGLEQIKKNAYIRYVLLPKTEISRQSNIIKSIGWLADGKEKDWNKGNGRAGRIKSSVHINTGKAS